MSLQHLHLTLLPLPLPPFLFNTFFVFVLRQPPNSSPITLFSFSFRLCRCFCIYHLPTLLSFTHNKHQKSTTILTWPISCRGKQAPARRQSFIWERGGVLVGFREGDTEIGMIETMRWKWECLSVVVDGPFGELKLKLELTQRRRRCSQHGRCTINVCTWGCQRFRSSIAIAPVPVANW